MLKFILFIVLVAVSMPILALQQVPKEATEWTQAQTEGADKSDLPRVLLLGDSICLGYRDDVSKHLTGKYYVDRLATSRSIDQDYYWKQLELTFIDQKYDIICFNFGLHGFHINANDYYKGLDKLAKVLKEKCPKVCYLLTTPMNYMIGHPEAIEKNKIVLERNEIAKRVMAKNNIEILDLYTLVDGNLDVRAGDIYHYNEKGCALFGKVIAEQIEKMYNK